VDIVLLTGFIFVPILQVCRCHAPNDVARAKWLENVIVCRCVCFREWCLILIVCNWHVPEQLLQFAFFSISMQTFGFFKDFAK